jgi:hypothetical protein
MRKAKVVVRARRTVGAFKVKRERPPSSVTQVEYTERHRFCVNRIDILVMSRWSGHMPDDRPSCDHPEDGICSHSLLSPEQLQDVNGRLRAWAAES